jgi:hypothetical protein
VTTIPRPTITPWFCADSEFRWSSGSLRSPELKECCFGGGLANIRSERIAHLWTRGWTPRIQTYPGREVPNPLIIEISKGDADISVVLKDILALTKLNYNTCIFGDGMPITLKFADAVGEILTAGPIKDFPPLPFGHYI